MKRLLMFSYSCFFLIMGAGANDNVYVSRFWHNHQPIYWPEWNSNGSQGNRVQYAWDSIVLKGAQTYNTGVGHPENDLGDIFGKQDRVNSYQSTPRNSLANLPQSGGFAMSYSGSLIDNVHNLGQNNQLGYGSGWWNGNREASNWLTPSGSRRMDLVGFTYHHSLGPLLPKSVFRKELQIFKEVWWKAWDKNSDKSDHSKGFFPTEMAFSSHMIDVLVDEGYEWSIVASHHLSRTCPTYFNQFDIENNDFGIFSSPPNGADLLGPSPNSGWWYSQPNPGNAAWNVSPFAYQLHKAKYVNPDTGAEKRIIMVPSDDVLSYRFGYSNEGIGKIQNFISPFANDSNRPVIVMPSSDGDNAWGGGSSSWFEATPQLFNASASAGYHPTAVQDFVNAFGGSAPDAHVEDGAWIFPESDYGSPYFLKWLEPPLKTATATNIYPNTIVDLETPGFALKFWSWANVICGANWCETAEQIYLDENAANTVEAWKIQAPYNWNGDGAYNFPNDIERAWHIYLTGLDSGFNYYGGLGNDDENKPSLATRRAIEILSGYVNPRLSSDATGPSVFKPQRFPYNPGAFTFGWFNSIPGGDNRFLKKMDSEFYIWTHVYDVSGVSNVVLKVRVDNDGVNTMGNTQNEVYAGGGDVGAWINISMTKRVLPNTQVALNAAADNGQINYFPESLAPSLADYYFSKITDANVAAFRGKLLDFYIEATDNRGNVRKTDIQHVYVADDGKTSGPAPSQAAWLPDLPDDCPGSVLDIAYLPNDGVLSNTSPIFVSYSTNNWTNTSSTVMTETNAQFEVGLNISNGVRNMIFAFNDGASLWDNNNSNNWSVTVGECPLPSVASIFPAAPNGCGPVVISYDPGTDLLSDDTNLVAHIGFNGFATVLPTSMTLSSGVWRATVDVTPGVTEINVAFRNGDSSQWDNKGGPDWNWPATGCVGPYNPDLCAIVATPLVTTDPATGSDQNNVGDNFDFDESGGALQTQTQGGFGTFGSIYVNVDDQALYIGGIGLSAGGSNNAMVVFVGLNTLNLDLSNLWSLNGAPEAMDQLHNVEFTEPMDLAILIGDEFGDGIFSHFNVGSGEDHGQGVFLLGPDSFIGISNALLSQFDGSNSVATVTTDDDAGDRLTDRWEVRIPWADLGATGYGDLNDLHLAGLILSDFNIGTDRYLSGNYLGQQVTSPSELDQNNNYGLGFVTLTPTPVCLPHMDGDGDGLLNSFEVKYFGDAASGQSDEDADMDGQSNGEEQQLGTSPIDADSGLILDSLIPVASDALITWMSVGGKSYRVEYNDDPMIIESAWNTLGNTTENDVADGVESTEDMTDLGPTPDKRVYRVRLL